MSDPSKTELAVLRDRIDAIDAELVELINERLAAARSIGRLKAVSGTGVLDARRELGVLERLLDANPGGDLGNSDLLRIYQSIISAARGLQRDGSREIDSPELYAVFGNPVGHSLSPMMHAAAFWATGYNGTYFAVEVQSADQITSGIKALEIRGGSVTIPHKISVIPFMDALDETARKVGAVNTILNQDGKLKGFNTDCHGVVRALSDRIDLPGKKVTLVGAGGAARAAAVGIQDAGGQVTICNRTAKSGARMADELYCSFQPLDKLSQLATDILINATPVGMTPAEDASVVPEDTLRADMLVMDLIYSPIQTRLLKDAAAAGCDTIDGSEMFIYQGACQFELWTGLDAPVDIMRLFVHAALKG
jgi:shikimate dehydrogenase